MPHNVRIAGLKNCHAKAEGWAEQVVSILDPRYKSFLKFDTPEKHLVLRFEDIETEERGERYPTIDDIQKAFNFIDDNKKLLVHCHGGYCRSTAVALGVLIRRGLSFEQAIAHVRAESPDSWPNILVVRHCDAILGLDGKLVSSLKDWQKTASKPSWFK